LPSPLQNAFINLYSRETDIIYNDALGNILMGKALLPRAAVASTLHGIGAQFEDSLKTLRHCGTQAEQEVGLVLGLLRAYPAEKIAATLAEAEFGRMYCVQETVETLIEATKIRHLLGRKLGAGGAGISGGERQRIALARCLAKESWKLLIVDEPFTSLDALAEDELSQVLRAYTPR